MSKLNHIAVIMDGNRRWAKNKGLKTSSGHAAGVEALEKVVKEAVKQKIKYLTVYALSTENLKNRDKFEILELFRLLQQGFTEKLPILKKERVRVAFFGDIDSLPLPVRKTLSATKEKLQGGRALQLNIAINYGARAEILKAFGKITVGQEVSEDKFAQLLDSQNIPDPDLIIRTGGEKRLSNFLLWQAAYSELIFTPQLWPDFDENSFRECIAEYKNRKRKFGV